MRVLYVPWPTMPANLPVPSEDRHFPSIAVPSWFVLTLPSNVPQSRLPSAEWNTFEREACAPHACITGLQPNAYSAAAGRRTRIGMRSEQVQLTEVGVYSEPIRSQPPR